MKYSTQKQEKETWTYIFTVMCADAEAITKLFSINQIELSTNSVAYKITSIECTIWNLIYQINLGPI